MIKASPRRLLVFKTVVEAGGVSAAADQIGISQPSVTAHLQALETEVGTALFVRRRGQKVRLTSGGELLYRYVCDTLSRSEELSSALRKLRGTDSRPLSLGLQRSLADQLMPIVHALCQDHQPPAEISIHTDTQEVLTELLRSAVLDVGLLFGPVHMPQFESEVIGHERLVVVAAPAHPLAQRRRLDPRELRFAPFVGPLRSSQFYSLVKNALLRIGVDDYNVVMQVQDSLSVKEMVRRNVGLACTLLCKVRAELEAGQLVALDLIAEPMELAVECVHRPAKELPEIGSLFVDHLKSGRVSATPVA